MHSPATSHALQNMPILLHRFQLSSVHTWLASPPPPFGFELCSVSIASSYRWREAAAEHCVRAGGAPLPAVPGRAHIRPGLLCRPQHHGLHGPPGIPGPHHHCLHPSAPHSHLGHAPQGQAPVPALMHFCLQALRSQSFLSSCLASLADCDVSGLWGQVCTWCLENCCRCNGKAPCWTAQELWSAYTPQLGTCEAHTGII